jgi:signal transduction histidine kinase
VLVTVVARAAPRFARPYPLHDLRLVTIAAAGAVAVIAGFVLVDGTGARISGDERRAFGLLGATTLVASTIGLARPSAGAAGTALHAGTLLFFVVCAVGFARRSGHRRNELSDWLGAGASVAAVACASDLVLARGGSPSPLVIDLLFLGAILLLFVGAVRDARARWSREAAAALVERQHEIAQELHDALGQDLALMVTYTSTLTARGQSSPIIDELCDAAQRALDDARRAMALLTAPIAYADPSPMALRGQPGLMDALDAAVHAVRSPSTSRSETS